MEYFIEGPECQAIGFVLYSVPSRESGFRKSILECSGKVILHPTLQ